MDGPLSQRKTGDGRRNDRKPVSSVGRSPHGYSTKLREEILTGVLEGRVSEDAKILETRRHEIREVDLADSSYPALAHTSKLKAACENLCQLLAQALQTPSAERGQLELEFQAITEHALALIRMNIDTVLSMPLTIEDLKAAVDNSRLMDCIVQEIRAIVCVLQHPPTDDASFQ